jgi:hypothetical protein
MVTITNVSFVLQMRIGKRVALFLNAHTYFDVLICSTASFTSVTGRLHTLSWHT